MASVQSSDASGEEGDVAAQVPRHDPSHRDMFKTYGRQPRRLSFLWMRH
jgi:hypothetical protein